MRKGVIIILIIGMIVVLVMSLSGYMLVTGKRPVRLGQLQAAMGGPKYVRDPQYCPDDWKYDNATGMCIHDPIEEPTEPEPIEPTEPELVEPAPVVESFSNKKIHTLSGKVSFDGQTFEQKKQWAIRNNVPWKRYGVTKDMICPDGWMMEVDGTCSDNGKSYIKFPSASHVDIKKRWALDNGIIWRRIGVDESALCPDGWELKENGRCSREGRNPLKFSTHYDKITKNKWAVRNMNTWTTYGIQAENLCPQGWTLGNDGWCISGNSKFRFGPEGEILGQNIKLGGISENESKNSLEMLKSVYNLTDNDSNLKYIQILTNASSQPCVCLPGRDGKDPGCKWIWKRNIQQKKGEMTVDFIKNYISPLGPDLYDNMVSTDPLELKPIKDIEFQNVDIGSIKFPGTYKLEEGVYTMASGGGDIWTRKDGFHYAYVPFEGDGKMVVQIISFENTAQWNKFGLMIRENLEPGARHFTVITRADGRIYPHWRTQKDMDTAAPHPEANFPLGLPVWLKLERKGDTFSASASKDGNIWSLVHKMNIYGFPYNNYIGIALSGVISPKLATGIFKNARITRYVMEQEEEE